MRIYCANCALDGVARIATFRCKRCSNGLCAECAAGDIFAWAIDLMIGSQANGLCFECQEEPESHLEVLPTKKKPWWKR